jgi:hypothetical protein
MTMVMKREKKEFLALDDVDYLIIMRLRRKSKDFDLLDETDQRILVWLLSNQPLRIRSWIDYVTTEYQMKGISINHSDLNQVMQELL